ncbi:MAG TPA: hypothetical protein VK853_05740 [Ilumatobacteraceae bacterium]|nr:hypothetical protein [Ilumatobacteraceae bacterium]
MTPLIIIAVAVLVVAIVASIALRRRPRQDDIASFRRQIDALSPEARRQTTDRMKPPNGGPNSDDGANGS